MSGGGIQVRKLSYVNCQAQEAIENVSSGYLKTDPGLRIPMQTLPGSGQAGDIGLFSLTFML